MTKREHGGSREISTAKHYLEDTQTERLSVLEPIWSRLREETQEHIREEPQLGAFLTANVLRFHSFDHACSEHLGEAIGEPTHPARRATKLIAEAFGRSLALCTEVAEDFEAMVRDRPGPSWSLLLQDDGYRGLIVHRVAAWLAHTDRRVLAEYLAGRATQIFGVNIELGATLTGGLVVHPGVSISRDSVVGQGAHLGRGAVIQGAVVGRGATVLPASVVLSAVPPGAVVGGIPARALGGP